MPRRISHLLLDFDCTITTEDTLHLIASAAYTRHSLCKTGGVATPPDVPLLAADGYLSWADFGEAYMADFDAHTERFGPRDTLDREREYLASLKRVEQASVRRVERSGLFCGVTEDEIRKQARFVKLRQPEALKLLMEKALKRGTTLGVISVTWSTVFVKAALKRFLDEDVLGQIRVCANEVVMGEDGTGTGALTKEDGDGIATGADKLRMLCDITGRRPGEAGGQTDGMVVYVGDSTTDFPSLLEADIGIVVDDNRSLTETCERLGIPMEQGLAAATPRQEGRKLYMISDWRELMPLIEGQ
ncbi:hypothetical protein CALVIDRAFT_561920 [Calocera viscosa TUFC12733]|uniref:HAD-like protein n=1 Tax=Calocera viscosa (strain TUFC12733) TaxID=1330018 RepID=A0A167P6A3_CALVF|nr:hypothetical protein CALVIDRAFT_561920 [Calocera viscosa TUFC12733]